MISSKERLGKNSNKEKAFPLETVRNISGLLCQKKGSLLICVERNSW
jgi:hypothetical protein